MLLGSSRYDAIMRAELAAIAGHEATLADEIERRRQAVMAADHEVRMLEKLRDKQRGIASPGEALLEIKQLDEIAARQSWQQADDARRRRQAASRRRSVDRQVVESTVRIRRLRLRRHAAGRTIVAVGYLWPAADWTASASIRF